MIAALYQNKDIRDLESCVINEGFDTQYGLMQKAGAAAFVLIQQHWSDIRRIVVCCGKGNNGGDGYIVARLAHGAGLSVTVLQLAPTNELHSAALMAAKACEEAGVLMQPMIFALNIEADLIVDALLGSGLQGEVTAPYDEAIAVINAAGCAKLALDVPSGLDVNTGQVQGCAVQADATITFIGPKQGLYTNKGPAYCGEIFIDRLNISEKIFQKQSYDAALLSWPEVSKVLARRRRDGHKGDYGHVLVIGGDYGMGGAVRMAAEAAMRVGAGLVSVATRPEHVSVVNCSRPEIMCHQVFTGEDLIPLIAKATVLVIGPGLGQSDWAKDLLQAVLSSPLPKVVDADALNLLSHEPAYRDDWVLTPHPGEASRLLDLSTQIIQDDRFAAVKELQQVYGGTAVLKGVGTIIKCGETIPKVCPAGNPGMATGGMGDVLSGVIGGLLAQGLSQQSATEAGVLVHAMAADRAAAQGGERGLLACDLMQHLRLLVNPGL